MNAIMTKEELKDAMVLADDFGFVSTTQMDGYVAVGKKFVLAEVAEIMSLAYNDFQRKLMKVYDKMYM